MVSLDGHNFGLDGPISTAQSELFQMEIIIFEAIFNNKKSGLYIGVGKVRNVG